MKVSAALTLTLALLGNEGAHAARRTKGKVNAPKAKGSRRPKGSNSKGSKGSKEMNFNRIATFPICSQIDPKCNTDTETVAEIVSVTKNGMTLVYSDSEQENIGFVDIANPSNPIPAGIVELAGEPTSVSVVGDLAVAGINTSKDFINTSGQLVAIDIPTKTIVKTWELGGQPDSVAVSPDGKYIVIAIENERDEDLGDGYPPQMPAGYVVVVETSDDVDDWVPSIVEMTGLAGLKFPEDPEPEFIAINENNVAVVTLQENNGIALIDLATKTVIDSFSAGTVDLKMIDTKEEDLIDQSFFKYFVPREPDGVTFMGNEYFATADEGDLDGGSRGFTIYHTDSGKIVFSSGAFMDQYAAAVGHYPEHRSGNKGVEPENCAFGNYEGTDYLFVNAERAGLTFVYDVSSPAEPVFKQILPTSVGPEGATAIPDRNLVVVAGEKDAREDKMRSTITIYQYSEAKAQYPTLTSWKDNSYIPFAALSGLSNDPMKPTILYAVEDSKYIKSRFFTIDTAATPALLTKGTRIVDSNGVFANVPPYGEFTAEALAAMINADDTVNIDPEGIAADGMGCFYIASEGRGTIGDEKRPIESLNFIFKVDINGVILEVITLPDELNDIQLRFGLEGVAYHPDGYLVACLQRAWGKNKGPLIGIYDLENDEWMFGYYKLDEPESQNGGWVGLSDITYVEGTDATFYVLERDNQGLMDAAVKRIYSIDFAGIEELTMDDEIPKTLVKDLIADDVVGPTGGLNFEKLEGLAHNGKGWWVVNDNDGVDDNSGEIQLMNLGSL